MSYQATCWAWNQQTESASQKLVLLALADACGGDEDDPRICWPSIKRITTQTDVGVSLVRKHLVRLDEVGLITKVERRRRVDGSLGTWVYTINFTSVNGLTVGEGPSVNGLTVDHSQQVDALESLKVLEPEKENTRAFDEFWKAYPRKIAKPAALRAWKRLRLKEHLSVMLGLSLWVEYWKRAGTEDAFVPYPQRWLNDRRWETPPETKAADPTWDEARRIWVMP